GIGRGGRPVAVPIAERQGRRGVDGVTVRLGILTGAGASRVLRTHDDGPAARPQLAADISLTPAALAPAAHRLGSRSATLPAASIHDDVRVRSGEHAVEVLEARRP